MIELRRIQPAVSHQRQIHQIRQRVRIDCMRWVLRWDIPIPAGIGWDARIHTYFRLLHQSFDMGLASGSSVVLGSDLAHDKDLRSRVVWVPDIDLASVIDWDPDMDRDS